MYVGIGGMGVGDLDGSFARGFEIGEDFMMAKGFEMDENLGVGEGSEMGEGSETNEGFEAGEVSITETTLYRRPGWSLSV